MPGHSAAECLLRQLIVSVCGHNQFFQIVWQTTSIKLSEDISSWPIRLANHLSFVRTRAPNQIKSRFDKKPTPTPNPSGMSASLSALQSFGKSPYKSVGVVFTSCWPAEGNVLINGITGLLHLLHLGPHGVCSFCDELTVNGLSTAYVLPPIAGSPHVPALREKYVLRKNVRVKNLEVT